MDQSKEVKITSSGKAYVPNAAELLGKTFREDPIIIFILSSLPEEERSAYLPTYLRTLAKAASLNAGVFQEANDWSSCAIWMPPGKRVDNPFTMIQAGLFEILFKIGIAGMKRTMTEIVHQNDICKEKALRDENGKRITRYWYLFFIATDFHARGQGLATKLITKFQERAAAEGLPIWLEATTAHSRSVYAKCGFEEVEELKIGRGTHAANGIMETDGPGVSMWAMLWKPPLK